MLMFAMNVLLLAIAGVRDVAFFGRVHFAFPAHLFAVIAFSRCTYRDCRHLFDRLLGVIDASRTLLDGSGIRGLPKIACYRLPI